MGNKENQITLFSLETIKRHLEALETYPELGQFAVQQAEIQVLLMSLIVYRLIGKNLNKKWVDKNEKIIKKISKFTLGQLLRYYKPYANKADINEEELYKELDDYNEKRNDIIHPKNRSLKELKTLVVEAFQKGEEIKIKLLKILELEALI
ncbi:MAG: hypothetical protein QXO40_04140 [Candidatus Aenigmatarchaeota archaeon]